MPLFARLLSALCIVVLLSGPAAAEAGAIRCNAFTAARAPDPAPRAAASVVHRFERINDAVKSHSYQVVFLGDSLTQRWDEVPENRPIWDRYFPGALNAGINGDRTEHLLWRIEHGNLQNQRPRAVVLLIGTNDLGHGRPPEEAAEGIRRILLKLRAMLPGSRILLQGLWPRSDRAHLAAEIAPVNQMIRQCVDQVHVFYADPGHALADGEGRLRRDLAPDGLHPNPAGYATVTPNIANALAPLLAGP